MVGMADSELEKEVLRAQIDWLKELLIKLGPKRVQNGVPAVRYLTLEEFIDEGLAEIERQKKYKQINFDDDIPF